MDCYENLAFSYDRLTNDVDYEATVQFYNEILQREGLHPRTAVDLACGTGSASDLYEALLAYPIASDSKAARNLWKLLLQTSKDYIAPSFQEMTKYL